MAHCHHFRLELCIIRPIADNFSICLQYFGILVRLKFEKTIVLELANSIELKNGVQGQNQH